MASARLWARGSLWMPVAEHLQNVCEPNFSLGSLNFWMIDGVEPKLGINNCIRSYVERHCFRCEFRYWPMQHVLMWWWGKCVPYRYIYMKIHIYVLVTTIADRPIQALVLPDKLFISHADMPAKPATPAHNVSIVTSQNHAQNLSWT